MAFSREILIGSPIGIRSRDIGIRSKGKEHPDGEVATDDEVQDVITSIFN